MELETTNLEAVETSAVESGPVYIYTVSNKDVNIRKKCAHDFETWVVSHNNVDNNNNSMIVTGAPPVENVSDYTLVHHVEDFVKTPIIIEEPEESQPIE